MEQPFSRFFSGWQYPSADTTLVSDIYRGTSLTSLYVQLRRKIQLTEIIKKKMLKSAKKKSSVEAHSYFEKLEI